MLLQPTLVKDKTLLKIENVSISYGKVKVVKCLSIEVRHGEIVAVIGSNGAGKSTLLRTISGFKSPGNGEIWFDNERIDSDLPQNIVRRGIAHILEGRKVFPQMTTIENLKMGAFLRKDKKEIKNDLERVFKHFPVLKERQKQRAGSLSGGGTADGCPGSGIDGKTKAASTG